jgi:hypothetical protein
MIFHNQRIVDGLILIIFDILGQRCEDLDGNGEWRKKTMGMVNTGPRHPIYKGATGSTRCGSFHSKELALTAMSR